MMDIAQESLLKLGIYGVIISALATAVYRLWSYGEKTKAAALKERDDLREERATLREACARELETRERTYEQELARLRFEQEQELARVRLDAQREVSETRKECSEKLEKMLVATTTFTNALEPMLRKLFSRLERRGS